MDLFVDCFKPVTEGFLYVTDAMELCVMGAHYCAVIADEFFTRLTVVP